MAFEDNVWDLCEDERGSALGSRMNGNILWTLGPPLPELQSNELFLDVYEVGEKTGLMFVLSYEESNPVLKPIEPRNLYNPKPLEYSAPAIPFKLYELTRCGNIGSSRE